eukprot:Gb_37892 [translate_table: standard]
MESLKMPSNMGENILNTPWTLAGPKTLVKRYKDLDLYKWLLGFGLAWLCWGLNITFISVLHELGIAVFVTLEYMLGIETALQQDGLAKNSQTDSVNTRGSCREKELAAVKINAADVDIIANELEFIGFDYCDLVVQLDRKVAERTLREHKGDAVAAIRTYPWAISVLKLYFINVATMPSHIVETDEGYAEVAA